MPFPYPARRAAFGLLALLAGPAAAQAQKPAVSPPPPLPPAAIAPAAPVPAAPVPAAPVPAAPVPAAPVPAAPPAVSPQVAALFSQAIAAHKALTAMAVKIAVSSSTGVGPDTTQTVTLAYQKPNAAKVAVANDAGPVVEFSSDGKTLTIYAVHDKKYRTDPVPAAANVIPTVLTQSRSLLAHLIGQPDDLAEILTVPGVAASVGTPDTVAGVPVDTVRVVLPAQGSQIRFGFAFGTADHLLRRLTQTASRVSGGATQTLTHTEAVTALSTTPVLSADDFAFTPPPGATKAVPAAPGPPSGTPPMHDPHLVPGAKPTAFHAEDLAGKPLSLAQYKGKVVLMDFWATWCGPCVGEMPNVIAAYRKYHAQGFDIVGISLDESRPALTAFLARNKMPWRQVFDGHGWESAVPRRYGVTAIPFGLLVGRDGRIAAVDVRGPLLTHEIRQALAKKVASAR